jgi:copper(I)-binding protein
MQMRKIIGLFLGLTIASLSQAGGHLMVDDAWVREAPPGAKALAGYMKLHNHGDKERVLVSAESPAFDNVMLHRTVFEGEMSKMVHQHMISVPANGMVSFEPNSYHLMMMKPKQALRAGDKISVTLTFKNGDTVEVTHEVRSADGGMDHGHHHHH